MIDPCLPATGGRWIPYSPAMVAARRAARRPCAIIGIGMGGAMLPLPLAPWFGGGEATTWTVPPPALIDTGPPLFDDTDSAGWAYCWVPKKLAASEIQAWCREHTEVPEPGTASIMILAFIAMIILRRIKR